MARGESLAVRPGRGRAAIGRARNARGARARGRGRRADAGRWASACRNSTGWCSSSSRRGRRSRRRAATSAGSSPPSAWRCSSCCSRASSGAARSSGPSRELIRGTEAIADGHLDERVRIRSTSELGRLGDAFNRMADRLRELQEDVRKQERHAMFGRVAAGLVHDLSHPFKNIQNNCRLVAEDARRRGVPGAVQAHDRPRVRARSSGCSRTSATSRGRCRWSAFPLDLNKLAGDVAESMRANAGGGRPDDRAGAGAGLALSSKATCSRSAASAATS